MPIHPPDPTDASHFGWGAHLEPMSLSFHGRWSEDLSQLHINMLEKMAIRFTLIKALKYIRHSCVMISTDNTTVVSYISKQGGTHSPNLCVQRSLQLLASAPVRLPASNPPSSQSSRMGVIKQSIRDKKFLKNVANFVSRSR